MLSSDPSAPRASTRPCGARALAHADLGIEGRTLRRGEPAGSGDRALTFLAGHGNRVLGIPGMLQHERTRRDEAGDLRIAEIPQQAEDIALQRLLPHALARREVARGKHAVDPFIQRPGVQREHPALAHSRHDHRHLLRLRFEPVHHGQRLLHLVADEVAAQLETLAVNPLPVRHIGADAEPVGGAELRATADQRGDDHLAARGEQTRSPRASPAHHPHPAGAPDAHGVCLSAGCRCPRHARHRRPASARGTRGIGPFRASNAGEVVSPTSSSAFTGRRSSTMPRAALSFSRVGLRVAFDCSMSRSAILSIPATIAAEKSGLGAKRLRAGKRLRSSGERQEQGGEECESGFHKLSQG